MEKGRRMGLERRTEQHGWNGRASLRALAARFEASPAREQLAMPIGPVTLHE